MRSRSLMPLTNVRWLCWCRWCEWAVLATLLCGLAAASGQTQPSKDKEAKPVVGLSPYARGEAMIEAYFRDQVRQIADACLADLTTREAWEKQREQLRQQFLDMMGLWPLPPRTDLQPVITGTIETDEFTVEKLHFQSQPGLYVTGNLYLPKPREGKKFPAVLYVCGHGNVVENGISYGSKVRYQYHPAWFAKHGYVCLVIDTLQLGEIQGLHHGTYREKMWWWHARGYTPAGVELWNGIRALDYLCSRPEVDPRRIGVTGRSGGGAYSWWIAAADERVAAAVPVAGIADLRAQLCEGAVPRLAKGVIAGHCDCMFFVNTYRWDFAQVAALIAPRPLLLGNSDADDIFPVPGYRRLADKVRRVYELYGASEKFQLLETQGPHKDTPELRIGINRWMHRWLRGDTTSEVRDDLPPPLKPQQLKVLEQPPAERLNEKIHEVFVPTATIVWPKNRAEVPQWWERTQADLIRKLREQVFGGWPRSRGLPTAELVADVSQDGVRLQAIDFVPEPHIQLRMFVLRAASGPPPREVILSVLDDEGWQRWCRGLGPAFADVLQVHPKFTRDDVMWEQNRGVMQQQGIAFAAVIPRGYGVTRWAEPGSVAETHIRRRFPLIGQTLDGQRVWDVRQAIKALGTVPDLKSSRLVLHGERATAGLALYAGLFEPSVAAYDLWHLPASHREEPIFLNILRFMDLPQAVALAATRPITLHVADAAERDRWQWPLRLQELLGRGELTVKIVGQ